jgi:hypothetical protein
MFLAAKHINPHRLSSKPIVCLDSQGGDVVGAINIGNKIRENGFDTCLESKYLRVKANSGKQSEVFLSDPVCASACVLALAGGVNRQIGENAKIGLHQFLGVHWKTGDSTSLLTTTALAGYLEFMGINRRLLDIALSFPLNEIYWLSTQEITQLNLRN